MLSISDTMVKSFNGFFFERHTHASIENVRCLGISLLLDAADYCKHTYDDSSSHPCGPLGVGGRAIGAHRLQL